MKHFFFTYDDSFKLNGLLEKYVNQKSAPADNEDLKVYYDITDIISDKRFEKGDELLNHLVKICEANISFAEVEQSSEKNEQSSEKEDHSRLRALEALWDIVERQYKSYAADNKGILYKPPVDGEQADQQYEISTRLVLYHLVRGNICLRISQCYYEKYELAASDSWAGRGIEIFWHGKNMVAALRDSSLKEKKVQADLYHQLIKLNLAKYYRDYARKNRRSDFDAALDEFKQVRCQIEEEYDHISIPEQKRQYVLIWLDAIINIVKIHRRKYRTDAAEKEILFIYSCLKDRLQIKDPAFQTQEDSNKKEGLQLLLKKVDKAALSEEKRLDAEGEKLLVDDADLSGVEKETFKKCDDLEVYDRRRYFLLVLLELARIRRDMHFEENYKGAIAIAIIADQWSSELDKRMGYTPGHNIDALITISSSLRKYFKFQETVESGKLLPKQIIVEIDKNEYQLKFWDSKQKEDCIVSLSILINKLADFAAKGHLKSKAEIIKWHCLYKQEPELLKDIKDEVMSCSFKGIIGGEKSNCQIKFLKGLLALRSEKYEEAVRIFTELLVQNPKEMQYIRSGTLGLKTRYLLANCYMAQAEFTRAEKILRELHDTLETVRKSRKSQGIEGSTDAETDARVEIDLGYCYMQRGAYGEAVEIYKELYGNGDSADGKPDFGLRQVKKQRRIMGLNNYASSCIFSLDDVKDKEMSEKKEEKEEREKREKKEKMEIARRIFCYMDTHFFNQGNEKAGERYEWNPETNLLKGYYTLCTGIKPGTKAITDKHVKMCQNISKATGAYRDQALIKAFPNFREACRFEEAFASRYDLLDEHDIGNKAIYRNEVERISVYIISLTKLRKIYLKKTENQDYAAKLFNKGFRETDQQLEYLEKSEQYLERFVLHFPSNYKISLKAAIALAEWLLNLDKMIEGKKAENKEEYEKDKSLLSQLYCSFSYITIYEERGAGVFNSLRGNSKFRLFTAAQRGKFCALLLAMYKPIKAIKEDCCFNTKDQKHTRHLVHYTSMETLKKILTGELGKGDSSAIHTERSDENASFPRFRINNCGYMNDVFEGKVFLKSIAFVSENNEEWWSQFVKKYFPQINRSNEDLLPSGSNVYIGSLSVKTDSFPLWNGYSEKESGCNIEFGEEFFDIKGIPYLPRALRDYTLSKYTDQDYPLYIVQYIGAQFKPFYEKCKKGVTNPEDDFETLDTHGHPQGCGTEAIQYEDLFRILRQINLRWKELDEYLEENEVGNAVGESKDVIRAFVADRINEIRFLFKDADYKYEGEVRVIYTDSAEISVARNNMESEVPRVYVNIERELEDLTIRLASRIEDATVDKYVTWLKHTKRVKKVGLAKQNRYTT